MSRPSANDKRAHDQPGAPPVRRRGSGAAPSRVRTTAATASHSSHSIVPVGWPGSSRKRRADCGLDRRDHDQQVETVLRQEQPARLTPSTYVSPIAAGVHQSRRAAHRLVPRADGPSDDAPRVHARSVVVTGTYLVEICFRGRWHLLLHPMEICNSQPRPRPQLSARLGRQEPMTTGGRRGRAPGSPEVAEQHLRALVGRDDARLRDDQWTAIEALVVDRRRALVVQRTGWGKSAVYFVATPLLRAQGAGPTVIVSPLLALMRNQIAAAERAGIRAVTINSTNIEEWQPIYDADQRRRGRRAAGQPRAAQQPGFRDEVLPRLAATGGLLVVDEAHCISDWGHDFRPDYRRIRTLLAELPDGIPVLATTATANARVTDDVAEQLGARRLDRRLVLRGRSTASRCGSASSGSRPPSTAGLARRPPRRAARLRHRLLPHRRRHPGGRRLPARPRATRWRRTPARPSPTERLAPRRTLLDNRVKALVATSALGMGFDKPAWASSSTSARPPSPIAYYQQVGRAGRGTDARGGAAARHEDRDIWDYFASLAFPREQHVRETLGGAGRARPADVDRGARDARRPQPHPAGDDAQGARRRRRGPPGAAAAGSPTGQHVGLRRRALRPGRARPASASSRRCSTTSTTDGAGCSYLREPARRPGGRAVRALRQLRRARARRPTVSEAAVAEAGERLSRPGVAVEPRRMWPTALANLGIDLKGKIADGAEEGRAVARLTDLGYGELLRALFRPAPRTARSRCRWRARWSTCWRTGASPRVGRHRRRRVGHAGRP